MKAKNLYLKALLIGTLMLMFVSTAYANDCVKTTLPISQEIVMTDPDDSPETLSCHYVLSTEQEDAPMPEGSKDGEYFFSIDGMDAKTTIPLCFNHAGVYRYTLYQMDKDTEYRICDRSHYEATVYVLNEPNGALSTQVIVQENGGEKSGEILFRTVYRDIPSSNPEQESAPQSSSPKTGDSVNITLWMILAVVSLFTLLSLLHRKRISAH